LQSQKEILIGVIEQISRKLIEAEKQLTELDSPLGDADCGVGVKRGFEAVQKIIPQLNSLDLSDILKKVGFTLAYTIGGTSGAMLGTGFIETGKSIEGKDDQNIAIWPDALEDSLAAIKRRGGNTQVGDKTLVDSLEPAVISIRNSVNTGEANMVSILEKALAAAKDGSEKSINMIARKGRASYLGERSVGHRDPGTVIICIMFDAALEYLKSSINA
jgi:dihydroxyacetone kinase-like protein